MPLVLPRHFRRRRGQRGRPTSHASRQWLRFRRLRHANLLRGGRQCLLLGGALCRCALAALAHHVLQVAEVAHHHNRQVRRAQAQRQHQAHKHPADHHHEPADFPEVAQQLEVNLTTNPAPAPSEVVRCRQKHRLDDPQVVLVRPHLVLERVDKLRHHQHAQKQHPQPDQPRPADHRRFVAKMPQNQPYADGKHHQQHPNRAPPEQVREPVVDRLGQRALRRRKAAQQQHQRPQQQRNAEDVQLVIERQPALLYAWRFARPALGWCGALVLLPKWIQPRQPRPQRQPRGFLGGAPRLAAAHARTSRRAAPPKRRAARA